MKRNPFLKKPVILALLLALTSIFIISCKKSPVAPQQVVIKSGPPNSLNSIYYHWGDLSTDRSYNTDVIDYDNAGRISKITSIPTYPQSSQTDIIIAFTYKGNQISLNTGYKDVYQLDNSGRVILHTSIDVQNAFAFNYTEQYIYDSNGYLSEVLSALEGTVYTDITYKVQNGNYISYTIAYTPPGGGALLTSRQYDFTYSNTIVKSPLSLFTPVFGDNSEVAIEKYLNFGKQSVNLLSGISYSILLQDGSTVQTGTVPVTGQVDAKGNLSWLSLNDGGGITSGQPYDNLSPLPRFVGFTYNY